MYILWLNQLNNKNNWFFSRSGANDEISYQQFATDDTDSGGGGGPNDINASAADRTHHRTDSLQALDRINTKMACTKESIRKEQTARDDNVNEYLKLAANADRQQLARIKAVFEKKNQKSAHTISQLQKKLENYSKRVREMQSLHSQRHQGHRQPREVLRDVGQGLKWVIRFGVCYAQIYKL